MSRVFKLRKNEKGQSLVEFALILPLLLLLIMAIVQFGVVFNGYITVSNAAREGARVGIIEKNNAKVESKVNEAFDASAVLTNPAVTISFPEGGSYTNGKPLSVMVKGDAPIIVPLMDAFFPGGKVEVSRTAVMMVEGFID